MAQQEQQAHSQKAQELLQALNIVNAHNYIVRQDPDGSTRTPERISAEAQPMHDGPSASDMDGDSSEDDDVESAPSHTSPEVRLSLHGPITSSIMGLSLYS